jgi:L-amino acid N-acyltransferase YncA
VGRPTFSFEALSRCRPIKFMLRRRIARREDLPHIVGIYNATVPSRLVTADTEPVTVESRVRWFDEHSADFRPLWVVEAEGQITAWLSFSSFYGRPAYNKTAEISMYVHEAHRKQGLGSYLLTEAMAHAPSLKLDTLLGFIFGHNAPSLALFEKFSFERWGELPKVATLDGIDRDLVIVGRRV